MPDATLTAYFIPFVRETTKTLPSRSDSMAFSVGQWRKILSLIRPPLGRLSRDTVAQGLHEIWGPALTEAPCEKREMDRAVQTRA
jgi:hypothetical protein